MTPWPNGKAPDYGYILCFLTTLYGCYGMFFTTSYGCYGTFLYNKLKRFLSFLKKGCF